MLEDRYEPIGAKHAVLEQGLTDKANPAARVAQAYRKVSIERPYVGIQLQ